MSGLHRDSVVVSCWSKSRPKLEKKTRHEVALVGEIRSGFSSPKLDGNENAPVRAVALPKLITNELHVKERNFCE